MIAAHMLTVFKDASPVLLVNRLSPRLPLILTVILSIALGIQVASIVLGLIPSSPLPPPGPAAGTGAAAPRAAPVDIAGIQNAHLFGTAAGAAADPANAPQTQLNLVLAGTIAANDPQKGLAIIGETAANARVYSVGKAVPGGAKLHAVYTDRAILDRSGQLEALLLPRQYRSAAPPPIPASAGAALASHVQQMMNDNPGSISEIMRPQAVFANGQQRGYRVYPGRNRAQFAQLGLQPGDLVMALNGTPLDDPARGMEIFQSIGSADQVRLIVERRGTQQELVLNLAQLANQVAAPPPEGEATPMDNLQQMPPNPDQD